MVLVVDDEQTVLRIATTALALAGFRPVVAENGIAGLECYHHLRKDICAVVADVIMPVMNGIEMVERIMELDPQARILLMSGYSDDVIDITARQKFPFIRKPFLPADLTRKIKRLVEDAPKTSAQP